MLEEGIPLHSKINYKIGHLKLIAIKLERWAKTIGLVYLVINIIVIILSQFLAFHNKTDIIFGSLNDPIQVALGIIVATLVAIQTVLHLERRSERASLLAAKVTTKRHAFETKVMRISQLPEEKKEEEEIALCTELNQCIMKILNEASGLKTYPVLRFPSTPVP